MKFTHSFKGVSESGNYAPIPNGVYRLRITSIQDGETRNGDPMANVTFTVVEGPFTGRKVFHNVPFLPATQPDGSETPGAGIAKHFLHVLGETYADEKVNIDTDRWFEKMVKAEVGIAAYTDKKNQKRTKNYIERFILEENGANPTASAASKKVEEEDVPF